MKNNVYPCKPKFYYIKVGFKGVQIIYACFRDDSSEMQQNDKNSETVEFKMLNGVFFNVVITMSDKIPLYGDK